MITEVKTPEIKMSRLRITKIDEYQYLTCLKNSLWGSRSARFKDWQEGDYLAFIVDKKFAGLAEVSGKPFKSKEKVWDNDLFPFRVPIKFVHILAPNDRIAILGEVRGVLTSAWGPYYGWGILNQQVLTEPAAGKIEKMIRSCPNSLSEIESNMEQLLAEAHEQRQAKSVRKGRRGRPKKKVKDTPSLPALPVMEEVFETKAEESAHSKAQAALIKLGKIAGCSIWIASNDRNRIFSGKPLGEGCLKTLPNLGLSEEAIRHISLIDTIWIRQNAPVCAFEIETTTSIYSGLLRMSDLLSVVPALNVKLYLVAPHERQEKVMTELSRPTFRKIGLNDFCKFVPVEELHDLLLKVGGLGGYIKPTILDTIAVEVEEEIDESEE
jgi:hypothetical protein